jgi:hypothetical protein
MWVGVWLSSGGGRGVVLWVRPDPALAFPQALRHHLTGWSPKVFEVETSN